MSVVNNNNNNNNNNNTTVTCYSSKLFRSIIKHILIGHLWHPLKSLANSGLKLKERLEMRIKKFNFFIKN
jgi:hypothetical protein